MEVRCFLRTVMVIVLILFVLTGCSNDSSSNAEGEREPDTVTISGQASDDPIAEAYVSVFDLVGTLLGSAKTDEQGNYEVDLLYSDIVSGYEIVVEGGRVNGQPFNAQLRALYGPEDDTDTANVTLITTLVSEGVDKMNEGKTLEQRDAAIRIMEGIGMVRYSDWSNINPGFVDMVELRQFVQRIGIAQWLSRMVKDLEDSELSAELMKGFSYAHGGITDVALDHETTTLEIKPGESKQYEIIGHGVDDDDLVFEVIEGPDWIEVDESGIMTIRPPSSLAGEFDFSFSIRVNHINSGFGRTLRGNVTLSGDDDQEPQKNDTLTWYKDEDEDLYSDGTILELEAVLEPPDGYALSTALKALSGDCNDGDAAIHPTAVDICGDGVDQDCDGKDGTDCPGDDSILFTDDDLDGYAEDDGDCNDYDPTIHPNADEIECDGIDQNCDGIYCFCMGGEYMSNYEVEASGTVEGDPIEPSYDQGKHKINIIQDECEFDMELYWDGDVHIPNSSSGISEDLYARRHGTIIGDQIEITGELINSESLKNYMWSLLSIGESSASQGGYIDEWQQFVDEWNIIIESNEFDGSGYISGNYVTFSGKGQVNGHIEAYGIIFPFTIRGDEKDWFYMK